MSIINLTKDTYNKEVMNTEKKVLIDFCATWCGPCRMVAPVIEEIAEENPDVKVCKVDVDKEPELADAFGIQSIPTLVLIKDKEIIQSTVGAKSKKEILKMINII